MIKSIEAQAEEYAGKRYDKYLGTHISESWSITKANYLAGAKVRDVQWLEVVSELREALKHTNEFCLCKRNTYGFDYHEDHPVMGKPKSGSRWLTPRDYNKDAITKADQLLKEMGINL